MPVLVVLLAMLAAAPAAAQVTSRPTDPPLVTAVNESWYQLREPVQFAGDLYYPAGATVFFNGNTMVRTGHYNGVPLYADATVEPFSIILVPVSRGLMQPYERPRRGDLAGTTGSRAPSFPGQLTPGATSVPAAAVAPTALPLPAGAISVFTPAGMERVVGTTGTAAPAPAAAPVGTAFTPAPSARALVSLRRPETNDGVWIRYGGAKYVSAGAPVPFGDQFRHVGEHGTFPVFVRTGEAGVIYLPTSRAGVVAPYRIKP